MLAKFGIGLISLVVCGSCFALALGDTYDSASMKAQTTPSQVSKLSLSTPSYKVYTTSGANNNVQDTYVNAQNKVFGFKWRTATPANFSEQLGRYYPEFAAAFAKRSNRGNHRYLNLSTQHLVVQQFGMTQQGFSGVSYLKTLTPSDVSASALFK